MAARQAYQRQYRIFPYPHHLSKSIHAAPKADWLGYRQSGSSRNNSIDSKAGKRRREGREMLFAVVTINSSHFLESALYTYVVLL